MAWDEVYIELHAVSHRDGKDDIVTKERKQLEPTTLAFLRSGSDLAEKFVGVEIWDLVQRAQATINADLSASEV